MKKVLSCILAIMMMATMTFNVYAAVIDPGNIAVPYWAYMSDIEVNVNFSGTAGTATATISRINGVTTLLEGVLTVYEKVGTRWGEVDSVSASSTRFLNLELDFDAESGTTYKAEVEVTAHGSSGSESDSVSKTKTCP